MVSKNAEDLKLVATWAKGSDVEKVIEQLKEAPSNIVELRLKLAKSLH